MSFRLCDAASQTHDHQTRDLVDVTLSDHVDMLVVGALTVRSHALHKLVSGLLVDWVLCTDASKIERVQASPACTSPGVARRGSRRSSARGVDECDRGQCAGLCVGDELRSTSRGLAAGPIDGVLQRDDVVVVDVPEHTVVTDPLGLTVPVSPVRFRKTPSVARRRQLRSRRMSHGCHTAWSNGG